ncbi:hypothetical protein OIU91_10950 [Streptomyces sp. NBC_01456]|uniref:tetratricopeptide repeat protein n=1 Tax=unclassified Streptomyces TaxID=2593676 RepID=UPI002E2FB747|nr:MULTISPECIES: hypothetical protein [unclassified Streptomyces]
MGSDRFPVRKQDRITGLETDVSDHCREPRDDHGPKTADFYAKLMRLYRDAGEPSQAELIRRMNGGIKDATLSNWMCGESVPTSRSKKNFETLIGILQAMAGRKNKDYRRRDIAYYETPRVAAQSERRTSGRRRDTAAAGETAAARVGRPVEEITDAFALEVHPAIDIALPPGAGALDPLPTYVERAHDAELRRVVQQAAKGNSEIAILVGSSSSGKTRACWESLPSLPGGWRLWHPYDPTRPEAALNQLDRVGSRTVVWLNDTQHYLRPPDLGERVAAKLSTLLNDVDRAPVLVLGTIWPEDWSGLTTPPQSGETDEHHQARILLTGHDISVPAAFEGCDMDALRWAAEGDPRLAYAADHAEEGQIAQYLAGAPALLERYRTAKVDLRALITVAMDARRLGHGLALPKELFADAAEGYLTDQQWELLPENWFEQTLGDATHPLRGARGPLTRIRPRRSRRQSLQDSYRLTDYLEQHGRRLRRTAGAPASLWEALVDHATPTDCMPLAEAAYNRGLLRIAVRLYTRAAEAGNRQACKDVVHLLHRADRSEETLAWYKYAAAAGDTELFKRAIELLRQANRTDEADTWLRARAEEGDLYALGEVGRVDEALAGYDRAARAGAPDALAQAGALLQQEGRTDEAIDYFMRAARAGNGGVGVSVDLLRDEGRSDEIIDWLKECTDRNEKDAWLVGMELLHTGKIEDSEEAWVWYERAAYAGNALVIGWATNQLRGLVEVGAIALDEAIEWLEGLADTRHGESWGWAAILLEEHGRIDKALEWYRRSAEAGSSRARSDRVKLLQREGRTNEAIEWLKALANGELAYFLRCWAMENLAELLLQEDRSDEAVDWLKSRTLDGDTGALALVGDVLSRTSRSDEAKEWYIRAANAGDREALRKMVILLREKGCAEEAGPLQLYGWEPDGSVAQPWNAPPPDNPPSGLAA